MANWNVLVWKVSQGKGKGFFSPGSSTTFYFMKIVCKKRFAVGDSELFLVERRVSSQTKVLKPSDTQAHGVILSAICFLFTFPLFLLPCFQRWRKKFFGFIHSGRNYTILLQRLREHFHPPHVCWCFSCAIVSWNTIMYNFIVFAKRRQIFISNNWFVC